MLKKSELFVYYYINYVLFFFSIILVFVISKNSVIFVLKICFFIICNYFVFCFFNTIKIFLTNIYNTIYNKFKKFKSYLNISCNQILFFNSNICNICIISNKKIKQCRQFGCIGCWIIYCVTIYFYSNKNVEIVLNIFYNYCYKML